MDKEAMKIKDQKEFPGATDDIYAKATPQAVRETTCELNNNPRNTEIQK